MKTGAPCRSAVPASKRTCGISEEKTRRIDIREVFPENRSVDFHAPADRGNATERLRRYASADRKPMQDVGYFSGLGVVGLRSLPSCLPKASSEPIWNGWRSLFDHAKLHKFPP
jgi:hypothetical protein